MAKLTLAQRVKKDPKLRQRVLANPGLRSKLPASMLTPELRQRRELNTRLAAPITPGSTVTERDLAHEATAAANVKYGDVEQANKTALEQANIRQRDMGGFYDQYLAQLAAHSDAVNTIGQNAAAAGLAAQQGITGLAGADLSQLQGNANAAAAAQGVTQAGNLQPMASNAAAIRQALVGSFVAQQAASNAANATQASNFAHIVGPQQKLGGMAMGQGRIREAENQIKATAKEKGAFDESFRAGRRADEAKQVLARQTLGADVQIAKDKAAASAADKATQLNKYGYTDAEWAKLSDKEKAKARKGNKGAAGGDPNRVYTSGPFAGKTKAEIDAMTPQQRQDTVEKYNNHEKPKSAEQQYSDDFYKKYGVRPAKREQVNAAKADIAAAVSWLKQGIPPDLMTTGGSVPIEGQKGNLNIRKLDPVFVRVAMDLKKLKGYISASTADRLHRAGYSVPGLGLKTPSHSTGPNAPVGKPPQNTGYGRR